MSLCPCRMRAGALLLMNWRRYLWLGCCMGRILLPVLAGKLRGGGSDRFGGAVSMVCPRASNLRAKSLHFSCKLSEGHQFLSFKHSC